MCAELPEGITVQGFKTDVSARAQEPPKRSRSNEDLQQFGDIEIEVD